MTDRIWKTDCARCIHACSQTVHIGDCDYGNDIEDWSCAMEDRMNDDDVELSNQGKCPFWSPNLDEVQERISFCYADGRDDFETLENVCTYLGININDACAEALRLKRIREVGDMLRNPDYHDIMVEMVHELEEEWE